MCTIMFAYYLHISIICTIIKSSSIDLKKRIREHVKINLAAYEYPRLIEFKKDLPLTTTGKIKRNILRKDHLEEKYERKI